MRTKIHSALFVDFDNLFTSLRGDYGDDTAEKFATHPGRWLDWLSRFDTPELADDGPEYRRILLRKCYLNPNGGYKANKDDKDGKGRWIGYGRYRVDFARAAFEVVDCPSLTRQRKSSTDITMALDVVDALALEQPSFGEFIILSGDADFTPVLLRLRRHDRRLVIVTPNLVSPRRIGPWPTWSSKPIGSSSRRWPGKPRPSWTSMPVARSPGASIRPDRNRRRNPPGRNHPFRAGNSPGSTTSSNST